jgi:hypothetical protein
MTWWSYRTRAKRICRAIIFKFVSELCSRCHLASYDDIIILRKVEPNLCDEHCEFSFEAAWFEKLMTWWSFDTRVKRICRAIFLEFVSEVCSRCHLASYDDIILRKVEPNLCDEYCEFGFEATWFEKLMSSWSYGTRSKRICRANFLKFVSEVFARDAILPRMMTSYWGKSSLTYAMSIASLASRQHDLRSWCHHEATVLVWKESVEPIF